MDYNDFVRSKGSTGHADGFASTPHDFLFPFQRDLVSWACNKGRAAIFADCGLGKTPIQLSFADNACRSTDGKCLILTPLAVSDQTCREAAKFGIDGVQKSRDGTAYRITVANYEILHKFSPNEFSVVVCDESSILKNYAGKTRQAITEFVANIPYRLLCTATPSPNDYMELGTSAEALGVMRRVEMLAMYFTHNSGETSKWELKGHAVDPFWQFVASWARALRKPGDLGYDDDGFVLPELNVEQTTVGSVAHGGRLFVTEAKTLNEQRAERRATLNDRCNAVAEIANRNDEPFIAWCSLNDESRMLTDLIDGAVEVAGNDSDDAKEEKMSAFSRGEIRCLVTKPQIAGFGMNWQHCNQMSFFPSHSHEQYYQAVRRCWRFGQKKPVTVHLVTSEAEASVLENMQRKERQSSEMFDKVIENMGRAEKSRFEIETDEIKEVPSWL
jgi:superfamily II DNA or RNA helicase